MGKEREIRDVIRNIAGSNTSVAELFQAEVTAVDGETCTVLHGELELTEVKLRAVNNGNENYLIITPSVGSIVLVADLSNGHMRDLCVVQYTQTDKLEIAYGEAQSFTFKAKDDDGGSLVELCLGEDFLLTLEGEFEGAEPSVNLNFGGNSILIEGDDDGGVKFNGGTNDGLARIGKIESNLEKLKSYVETLQMQSATAMAPMSALDTGTSVVTFNSNWSAYKAKFSFEDMENTKIKH